MVVRIRGERWKLLHYDLVGHRFTFERARRWFKGHLLILTDEEFERAPE